MSYIIIPKPGTKLGPCVRCNHRDCAALRVQARETCVLCGREIGYETAVTADSEGKSAHFDCVLAEL